MKLTQEQRDEFRRSNLSFDGMIMAIYEAGRQAALCELMDMVKEKIINDKAD